MLRNELDLVFLACKHAWPFLRASGAASVLLVGSTAGITGSMTNTRIAHTASKGAVVAMTRQLAAEGAPHGIRVNCISPGMIRTPATENDLLADDHPMRQIARRRVSRVAIPYEGTFLPGYFNAALAIDDGPAPVVILVNGLDSTKEHVYSSGHGAELAARGISCLMLDQPGTGEALRLHGLTAQWPCL